MPILCFFCALFLAAYCCKVLFSLNPAAVTTATIFFFLTKNQNVFCRGFLWDTGLYVSKYSASKGYLAHSGCLKWPSEYKRSATASKNKYSTFCKKIQWFYSPL